jgi:hypothetical protein
MKTLLITILILFASTTSKAQMKGIPFDIAVPMEDVEDENINDLYGQLIKLDQEDGTI